MKKKKNRVESRKKIQAAVIELLKDHDLKDLKVTAICEKAQINRSSFYDNYTDIYDLIAKLKSYLVDEYRLMQKDVVEPSFVKLLEHVQANPDLYRLFFKLDLQAGLAETFPVVNLKKSHYDECFFRSGIVAVIADWLQHDCDAPISELVEVIEAHHYCLKEGKKRQ